MAAMILICPRHFGQIEMSMLNTRFRSLAQEILFADVASLLRSASGLAMASWGGSFLAGTEQLKVP